MIYKVLEVWFLILISMNFFEIIIAVLTGYFITGLISYLIYKMFKKRIKKEIKKLLRWKYGGGVGRRGRMGRNRRRKLVGNAKALKAIHIFKASNISQSHVRLIPKY
mgnify:CR=1 FL=1